MNFERINIIVADKLTTDIIGSIDGGNPQFLEELGNQGSGTLTLQLDAHNDILKKRNIVHIYRGNTFIGSWLLDTPSKDFINSQQQRMVTWTGPGLRKWMEDGEIYPVGAAPWDINTPKTRDFNFSSVSFVPDGDWVSVTAMSRQDAQSLLGVIDVASAVTAGGDPNSAPLISPSGKFKIPGFWFSPGFQVYWGNPYFPVGISADWWDITGFQPSITTTSGAPTLLFGMPIVPYTGTGTLAPGYVAYATQDAVTEAWSSAFPLVWWNGDLDTDSQAVTMTGVTYYTLTFDGQTTAPISSGDTGATIKTRIESLSNVGAGNISVSGSGTSYVVVFDPPGVTKALDIYIPKMSAEILAGAQSGELFIINAGDRAGSFARIGQGPVSVNQPPPPNWGDVNPWKSLPADWPTATAAHARWIWTEDVRGNENVIQTLTQIGSGLLTFNLTFNGQPTGSLNWNDSPATVQSALESLVNIAPGDVTVTNVPGFITGSPLSMVVEFSGAYSTGVVPVMTSATRTEVSGDKGSIAVFATSFKSNVPQGTSYFRKEFTIPAGPSLQYSLFLSAQDGFTAYIDGAQVAKSSGESNFFQTTRVDFTLSAGPHVVGVKVTNNSIGAGLLATLVSTGNITLGTTAKVVVITDSSWSCNVRPADEPGFTAGNILLQFLGEASARGVQSLARLVPTFTDTHDTYGNLWDATHDWSFDVGNTFRQVVEKLEELVCDVEIRYNPTVPQYELNAYVKQGQDKTATVQFFQGHSITAGTEEENSFVLKTDLLVQHAEGFFQWPTSASSNSYGRIESFLPSSASRSFTQSLADLTLAELALIPDGTVIEFIPENGVVPWSDFQLGDQVTGPHADGTIDGRRIHSISFSINPSNASEITYAVEFDTISVSKLQELQRKLNSLNDNGLTGTVVNASVPLPTAFDIGALQAANSGTYLLGGTVGDDSPAGYGSGQNRPPENQKQYFDSSGNAQVPGNVKSGGRIEADGEIIGSSLTVAGVTIKPSSGTVNAPNVVCQNINGSLYNAIETIVVSSDTTVDSTMWGTIVQVSSSTATSIILPKLTVPADKQYDSVQTLVEGGSGLTSYTLTFNGHTTGSLASTATPLQIQTALLSLAGMSAGDVVVQGTVSPIKMQIIFRGQFLGQGTTVPIITTTPTGGSGTLLVAAPRRTYSYVLEVYRAGAGVVQLVQDPVTTPTLNSPSGLFLRTQFTSAILRMDHSQVWHVGGLVSV